MTRSLLLFAALATVWTGPPASAQEPQAQGPAADRLNVFFDCEGPRCDSSYYRTEIPWVNWVRNREDSDVHLIMTSQANASGGRQFRLDFIGRARLDGVEDQLQYASLGVDTEREELDGITNTLAIGLARLSTIAGLRTGVTVEGPPELAFDPTERVVAPSEVDDPWNLWVFRVSLNGNLDGEETRQTKRANGSVSVSRTTPTWKLDFDLRGGLNRQEFERSDGSTLKTELDDWNVRALVVYSVARHWSVGLNASSGQLPRFNQQFRLEVRPAVEYSFFPYEEATRRALTAFYEIGPTYRDYEERTIFNETEETRFEEQLEIRFSQRQQWGDASASVTGSHFLDDIEKRRLSLRGNLSFRIFRGLSLNAGGDVSWVRDQVYLSADEETDEEILLRLRQRATDYNYGLNFGFSYQFGSIFNNVVNNRFRRGPGRD